MTFCFPDRLRIASFGPKQRTVEKKGEETCFLSNIQDDSEIFTFEIEENGAKKAADKAVNRGIVGLK